MSAPVSGRPPVRSGAPRRDEDSVQISGQTELNCTAKSTSKSSENEQIPSTGIAAASVHRPATILSSFESPSPVDPVVQQSVQTELIWNPKSSGQFPPVLFTATPEVTAPIPAISGLGSPIKTPIRNAHDQTRPLASSIASSESGGGGKIRSTNFSLQEIYAMASKVNYSGSVADFCNSYLPQTNQVMGKLSVSSIAGNSSPIRNAQIEGLGSIPATISDQLPSFQPGSSPLVTGSVTPSSSPVVSGAPVVLSPSPVFGGQPMVNSSVSIAKPIPASVSASSATPFASFRDVTAPSPARQSFYGFGGLVGEIPEPAIVDGIPGILFPDQVISTLSVPFQFALIGRVTGNRGVTPNSDILAAFSRFGFLASFTLKFLPRGFLVLIFSSEEDYLKFWPKDLVSIGSVSIRFFKWTPEFKFEAESSIVPVWVRIPDLPLHLYDKKCLYQIGKLLGNPVMVDEITADGSRGSFARICVEIDVLLPRQDEIWIGWGSHRQILGVVYEKVPYFCTDCKLLGHSVQRCSRSGYKAPVGRSFAQGKRPSTSGQPQGFPTGSVHSSGPASGSTEPGWVQQRRRRRPIFSQVIPPSPISSNQFEVLNSISGDSVPGGNSGVGSYTCSSSSSHVLEAIVEDVPLVPQAVVSPMHSPPAISVVVTSGIAGDAQGSGSGASSSLVDVVPVVTDPMIVSTVPVQMDITKASGPITSLPLDLGNGSREADLELPPTTACQSLPLPGRTRSQQRRFYRTQKSQVGSPYGRPPDSG